MREISPAENLSVDECLKLLPEDHLEIVHRIREQKIAGNRPKPSASLLDRSLVLTETQRRSILDKVASLVDENLGGRSEMCKQFAELLTRALNHLNISARAVCGKAIYYDKNGSKIFEWDHAWTRIGKEVIDGNVDSLYENPEIPPSVNAALKIVPYWGPVKETPPDRMLREAHGVHLGVLRPNRRNLSKRAKSSATPGRSQPEQLPNQSVSVRRGFDTSVLCSNVLPRIVGSPS